MRKKSKATFKLTSTGNSNLYIDASSAIGVAKVEPPPPDRWAAAFKVRSLYITMRSHQKNRDRAMLEMSQLLYNALKEPWGVTLDSMYRL